MFFLYAFPNTFKVNRSFSSLLSGLNKTYRKRLGLQVLQIKTKFMKISLRTLRYTWKTDKQRRGEYKKELER